MVKHYEMRKDGCKGGDKVLGRRCSCYDCPFDDCIDLRNYRVEVREDGCWRADKAIGGISSCKDCPFDVCGFGGIDIRNENILDLIKGVSVRPLLKSQDLELIVRALMVYGEKCGEEERECCDLLVKRMLKKQGFGSWRGKGVRVGVG